MSVDAVALQQASPERAGESAVGSSAGETGPHDSNHTDLEAYRHSRRISRNSSTHPPSLSPSRTNPRPRSDSSAGVGERPNGAPACLVDLTDRVQACSQSIQAWSDQQEEKARAKKEARRNAEVRIENDGTIVEPKGDSWLQRKAMIIVVSLILAWVYIVFVWRICVAGIRREPRALVDRAGAIGLLVGFNVLFLMTVWTYVKVTLTGPGLVRDHVPISGAPNPPSDESYAAQQPESVAPTSHVTAEYPSTEQTSVSNGEPPKESQTEETVDPTLPAIVGPLAAGQVAKVDEEKAVMAEQERAAGGERAVDDGRQVALWPGQPQQQTMTSSGIPEPLRIPPQSMPLHPNNLYCYRCKRIKPPRAHHCRHCATCVLKMDHHCPWVGGCVGARNHKFFFHFLQWVTMLEIYVLVTTAVLFHRGIQRRGGSDTGWPIDGYMISLFPITALFTLFTTALLITHSYLFVLNLTTIEHMAYDRMKTREEILLSRFLDARTGAGEKLSFGQKLKEKRRMKTKWASQWGNLKTEANLWWIDDEARARESKRARGWYDSIWPNWSLAVGNAWYQSFLPLGRAKSDGLAYDTNWRFGQGGLWRMREAWRKEE